MLHGWPGSIREFYSIIPLLTEPRPEYDFVFEFIAPSLPGFGFSDPSSKPGLGPVQMASIFNDLMKRLGFDQYYIQGGDWGAIIGSSLTLIRPENVLGYHSNFCLVQSKIGQIQTWLGAMFPSFFIEEHKQIEYSQRFSFIMEESGYFHIQASKPDTIGVGVTDSPVGLAVYILEKFSTGTNRNWRELEDGGLEYFDKSAILDNLMIYWITNSITSSFRIYAEAYTKSYLAMNLKDIPITVPSACARFNHEIDYYSTSVLSQHYKDLVQLTDYPKGGHLAAFEMPLLLAEDIWRFVKSVRSRNK